MFLVVPRPGLSILAPPSPTSPRSEATILKLRVGTYPTHTRVVLDTATPLEWFVNERGPGGLSILVPGGVLAPAVRPIELSKGVLRGIRPLQRPGGVEVSLLPQPGSVTVRSFTLTSPDRIVIDVLRGEPAKSPLAGEAGGSTRAGRAPSAGSAGTARQGAGAARDSVPGGGRLTVVLDPGHGGHDTGAVGPTGLTEKEVVLDLALRLRPLLQRQLGLRVILTRSEDVFVRLSARSALANRAKADFFVSLHLNGSAQRHAAGFETFYYTREPSDTDARTSVQRENLVLDQTGSAGQAQVAFLRSTLADLAVTRDMKESSQLAELELTALSRIIRVENRGVKSGPFYVLATAAMPAVLVESAFITNRIEERKLRRRAYRQRLAEALCDGIGAFVARYVRRAETEEVSRATPASAPAPLAASRGVQTLPR
jgi:N-acetylmuramoyl-L-alanine amidase